MTFFSLWALFSLLQVALLLVFGTAGLSSAEVFRVGHRISSSPLGTAQLDFLKWADLTASLVTLGLVLVGLVRITQGRHVAAFTMFERAVLVSIFFTQVFAFVYSQFAAVFGLFVDLILFVAVRAALTRELELETLRSRAAGG